MGRLSRRDFIKGSLAASAVFPTFVVAGTKASGKVLGANDAIRIGVAGIHGRGNEHLAAYLKLKEENVRITYLIDPDSSLFMPHTKLLALRGGGEPTCVQDVRMALDDKNLDALSIATPNHWHSLLTVWACQAGKDVYCEKPLSHEPFEGRKCVEAARKYDRIVQHGTQNRSDMNWARQIAAVQSGKYGKLLVSKGYACKPRGGIGFKSPETPPEYLDFNIWLGPAPKQPYHTNLVHYNWHWFWDTGNGEIGNQGVHQMDVARWAIKDATLPKSVWSLGGRFGYTDQGQTPNTLMSVFDFGETLLVFEVRGLVDGAKTKQPQQVDNEFYLEAGAIKNGMFHPKEGGKGEKLVDVPAHVNPGGPFGSFIHAVRSRKREDLNADVEIGHYSAALCHLGNISYRLGAPAMFDKRSNAIGDNREVVQTFEYLQENLREAGLKLEETQYMLGPQLEFDAGAEKFVGPRGDEANALARRKYREPFVVPEQV